jgi:hypothetical protein
MGTDRTRIGTGWRGAALHAATIIAIAAGSSASSAEEANALARARARVSQSTSDDPCRYFTAQEMGKALGRPMKSSKRGNVCEYRGAGTDVIAVKVEAGPEGTILRHVKKASAEGHKEAQKVATATGEAYFDSVIPVFIGRVGNHDVQVETTIEPAPRETLIAIGTRIMETLARK